MELGVMVKDPPNYPIHLSVIVVWNPPAPAFQII